MSLTDVRYQATALQQLQRAYKCERIPHAYIFHGPEGVGREMLALRFAQLLLCKQPITTNNFPEEYLSHNELLASARAASGKPSTPSDSSWHDACNQCEACHLALADTHPDIHIIHRQLIKYHDDSTVRNRKGLDLGVDVIRQFVIDAAAIKPAMGQRKIFIIREADLLTTSAQNALLKTIEEPPPHTYLILIARSLEQLLPTTLSRCQRISLSPLPSRFIAQQIRSRHPDLPDDPVHFFAHHEPGSLGIALQLIEDGLVDINDQLAENLISVAPTGSTPLAKWFEETSRQLGKKIRQREPDATEADSARRALSILLSLAATFYRDLLSICCNHSSQVCNNSKINALEALAGRLTEDIVSRAIQALALAEYQLKRNVNTRLCLDSLAIELANLAKP